MTHRSFSIPPKNSIRILTSASILLVLFSYLWLGSFGLLNHLPTITAYYDKLATAFSHGSLSLEEQPDPALLALDNPYSPAERGHIDVPTDYSLYNGKYYLYFGPVPAVLLTITKLLGFGTKGDQYPAFVFICGIFVVQSLLLIFLQERYFQNIPAWLVLIGIFFIGFISPFPWIITRARFYEAASTSGQFFFLLGLYFILTRWVEANTSRTKLLLGGASWALALGSRPTQIIPIGFTILMFLFLEYRNYAQHKQISRSIQPFIMIAIPFAIGISILGWYNWARFNSVFETGFYYELAGPDIQRYYQELFSPVYVLPNFYNYIFNKPILIDKFPLLNSSEGIGQSVYPFLSLSPIYYTGKLTGILYTTPFILFASILLLPRKKQDLRNSNRNSPEFKWMIFLLFGIFLAEFIPFVSYFWVETRFIADFMPPLALLSIMGFWKGDELLRDKKIWRILYLALGISLMVFSILAGISLGLAAHWEAFKEFNPTLWKAIYREFYPQFWKQLHAILSTQ